MNMTYRLQNFADDSTNYDNSSPLLTMIALANQRELQ